MIPVFGFQLEVLTRPGADVAAIGAPRQTEGRPSFADLDDPAGAPVAAVLLYRIGPKLAGDYAASLFRQVGPSRNRERLIAIDFGNVGQGEKRFLVEVQGFPCGGPSLTDAHSLCKRERLRLAFLGEFDASA